MSSFEEKSSGATTNGRAPIRALASYATPHPPQTKEPEEYYIGEIYQKYDWLRDKRWLKEQHDDGSYLGRIKSLAQSGWPQLGYLADFIDCSTVPMKRRKLTPEDKSERTQRFHVVVIDLSPGQDFQTNEFWSIHHLEHFLETQPWRDQKGYSRLFVLEDLSSTMIEWFGGHFNLDPSFFRSQLSDYTWFNIRDPWFEISTLPSRARASAHFILKYIRPVYLPDMEAKQMAKLETGRFNVLRRMDFDETNKSWADKKGSMIGLLRASTSCYVRPSQEQNEGWLGFVSVDPSVEAGYPLWGGYDGVRPPPNKVEIPSPINFRSPMMDFVQQVTTMSPSEITTARAMPEYLLSPVLCSIPANWLLCFEHIMNRLSLIEWEIEHEAHRGPDGLDESLRRLHPWRRRVVNFSNQIRSNIETVKSRFGEDYVTSSREWRNLIANFEMVEHKFKVLEAKVDKIMIVLTAMMSIQESKKAITNGRDVARITYLAFIYVPMSFVASFLSMNTDFPEGPPMVYWVFFVIALPLTGISLFLAVFWKPICRTFGKLRPQKAEKPPEEILRSRKKKSVGI